MARTLKDVYIKVTENNRKELGFILHIYSLQIGDIIVFTSDELKCVDFRMRDELQGLQKVSLSELKRLIDTIPTREEITRLKRQISAYKLNISNHKHDLEMARNTINQLHDDERSLLQVISNLNNENKQLNEMYDELVVESGKKQNLLKNLYDDALKEIEGLKNTVANIRKEKMDYLEYSKYWRLQYKELLMQKEQLKNKKWYQIWK